LIRRSRLSEESPVQYLRVSFSGQDDSLWGSSPLLSSSPWGAVHPLGPVCWEMHIRWRTGLEFPLLGGFPHCRGPSHDVVGQFPHERLHSRVSNLPSATESSAWPAVCLWYSYHSLSACSLRAGVSRWSLQLDPCERLSELSFGVWPGCGFRSTLAMVVARVSRS
jgi:hypothetical protein